MKIDLTQLEAELKEVAGTVKVKVKKHNGCRCSVRETDSRIEFRINPKHIRSDQQLGMVRQFCFSSLE